MMPDCYYGLIAQRDYLTKLMKPLLIASHSLGHDLTHSDVELPSSIEDQLSDLWSALEHCISALNKQKHVAITCIKAIKKDYSK